MRALRPVLLALSLCLSPATVLPALAEAPSVSPVPAAAEPVQFYVFSFTDTPVGEAARDVVETALAYELTIDPAVDGLVTFRADGWYTGEALLKDLGVALLDQDIALMQTAPGAYAVIPRANVPMMLARGGTLMTLPEPTTARPPTPALSADRPVVYGRNRWWDGALAALIVFFAGALAGAGALLGGQSVYRQAKARERITTPLLRLTDQRLAVARPPEGVEPDPDLIIPRFEDTRA